MISFHVILVEQVLIDTYYTTDPSISYTRFDEFEQFWQENGSYDYIAKRRVSYLSKFLQIIDY